MHCINYTAYRALSSVHLRTFLSDADTKNIGNTLIARKERLLAQTMKLRSFSTYNLTQVSRFIRMDSFSGNIANILSGMVLAHFST